MRTHTAHRALAAALLLSALLLAACSTQSTTVQPPETSMPADVASSSASVPNTIASSATTSTETTMTFAVIGDYGMDDKHEKAVAKLVDSWDPEFVVATGDCYYRPAGGSGTGKYDESTGAYYRRWLKDITTTGKRASKGQAEKNAFFPSLGNHDYSDATPSPQTYLKYFRLPGAGFENSSHNERYYDFVVGDVHLFALNSNSSEKDGTSRDSKQARWLKEQLGRSTERWNIVFDHHPPYSSDRQHGSSRYMRWPFADWGADVVLSGHAHTYERVQRNGIAYFVNGLGGAARYAFRSDPVSGSKKRYQKDWGAQRVTVASTSMRLEFFNVDGKKIDSYTLKQP